MLRVRASLNAAAHVSSVRCRLAAAFAAAAPAVGGAPAASMDTTDVGKMNDQTKLKTSCTGKSSHVSQDVAKAEGDAGDDVAADPKEPPPDAPPVIHPLPVKTFHMYFQSQPMTLFFIVND